MLGSSIPIIPWTNRQEIVLSSPLCLLLLHKLGFHLPGDVGKRFPRIPHFWTWDVLLSVARKLGTLPAKTMSNLIGAEVNEDMDCQELSQKTPIQKNDSNHHKATRSISPHLSKHGETNGLCTSNRNSSSNSFGNHHYDGFGRETSDPRYGFPFGSHTVNWMNLAQKSKHLFGKPR